MSAYYAVRALALWVFAWGRYRACRTQSWQARGQLRLGLLLTVAVILVAVAMLTLAVTVVVNPVFDVDFDFWGLYAPDGHDLLAGGLTTGCTC